MFCFEFCFFVCLVFSMNKILLSSNTVLKVLKLLETKSQKSLSQIYLNLRSTWEKEGSRNAKKEVGGES